MIAVIDACTILNLLQIFLDEKYIGYLESVFQNVFISPKVFDEINENKYKNLSDENAISDIDTIIYSKIHKFVTNEDTEECCEIVKNATGYFKKTENSILSHWPSV